MRIAVAANPNAGRGEGASIQARFVEALRAAGHDAWSVELSPGAGRPLADAARQGDVLVLIGGDGTVHHALPHLSDARAALWHCPAGTENLFARECGSTAEPADLLDALREPAYESLDLGVLTASREPRSFALMWSLGPDAGVIHRISATRRGAISRWSYAAPVLYEFNDPALPELSIKVDGKPLATGERGMIVVANARAYGFEIDPASDADMRDGKLDAVFIPSGTAREMAGELMAARHRRPGRRRVARGVRVEVVCASPSPTQLDGEVGPILTGEARLGVRPGALRVLARAAHR